MAKEFDRVATLIAASGLDDRTILEALRSILRMGPGAAADEIKYIRRAVISGVSPSVKDDGAGRSFSELEGAVDQAIRLLQEEARLPAAEAAYMLSAMIERERGHRLVVEYRPKEGFRRWLTKLAKAVGPSQLLHYATRARNEYIHSPQADWTLRAGKED